MALDSSKSAVFHRHLAHKFEVLARGSGNYLYLQDGRAIFDASGGAAVACLGHGDARLEQAIREQMEKVSYCGTVFFTTPVCEELCAELVASTGGHMSRAYIVSSGSEAMEAALKLARQYFLEKEHPEPERCRFISRSQSYHGITLGALSVGGHKWRRAKFEPLLTDKATRVSPCYPYRMREHGESDQDLVTRLALELDAEFQRVGPRTVCAFVVEPVVGAALGCVPPVRGYLEAAGEVCRKHGALFIMDEVMCGMGRTGTLHAWQLDGFPPDIQTVGKGLGGGYQPVAGVLVSNKVATTIMRGSGIFSHGQTYQAHPVACAAALAVQRIIRSESLLQNIQAMGLRLRRGLEASLASHPNVGDIRGRGLFWGIEFVQDKKSKRPFPATAGVASAISELGLTKRHAITVYPCSGIADGADGDAIIIAPAYNITPGDADLVVEKVGTLIYDFFDSELGASGTRSRI